MTATSAFIDSKKHLLILDALRGIAAIMVILMHTFELYCEGKISITQGAPIGILVVLVSIALAFAALKWYDLPIRSWLARRFIYEKGGN